MTTNNDLIPVIIDKRERKLIALFKQKEDKKLEISTKQLDVTDIVINSELGIERKEGFDYVASLIDTKLFEELLRLRDAYENRILIVEGLNEHVFKNIGVRVSSIYGSLVKISYKLRVSVIPTLNLEHTAITIERIAIQEAENGDGLPIIPRAAPKKLVKY